jgi:outer membrane protein OmpA-like peptidoglycan-associated protein
MDTLQSVLAALMRVPSLSISIEGHTDRYGSVAYNSKLAQSRAEAVRRQLMRLAGKDAKGLESRVLVKAFDEQCLLTTAGADEAEPPPANRGRIATTDRKAQADNRRVEIWQVLDGKGSPSSCRSAAERAARVPFTSLK